MNFKRYHASKNLFDPNSTRYHMGKGTNNQIVPVGNGAMFYIEAESNMTYTIKVHTTDGTFARLYLSNAPIVENVVKSYNVISESETIMNPEVTIANTDYAYLWIQVGGTWYTEHGGSSIMLNTGSEALPYEPYSSEVWHDTPHYIHNTSTDTLQTLPAVLYPNAVTATVGLKGQTLQSSIPSPTSPVMPQGTGDLETSGAKAGQYKIPISSANTTTPVYLGEVESTRKIKKLVLTGNETWERRDNCFRLSCPDSSNSVGTIISTHFKYSTPWALVNTASEGACVTATYYGASYKFLMVRCDDIATTIADFKTYLQQQYAAGTPVTVWYVLATETTGIVNEPLRKIGDYADTVSGISIPTITGANSFDVLTTLKPSEVTVNYKGWHTGAVRERDGGQWN